MLELRGISTGYGGTPVVPVTPNAAQQRTTSIARV